MNENRTLSMIGVLSFVLLMVLSSSPAHAQFGGPRGTDSPGTGVAASYGLPGSDLINDLSNAPQSIAQDPQPLMMADMNGDGMDDIVHFRYDGVYVSLTISAGMGMIAPFTVGYKRE